MFIVHLIRPDNTCTPLAFALSDSEASHLVSACAMQYIESQCGSERCSSAFEPPNAEGMYLVKESDVSLRVQQKKAVVVAAGWFSSESLTVEDTLVGHIRADEFHVDALHPETKYVLPIPQISTQSFTLPRSTKQPRKAMPWLGELTKHARFKFKED